jgi:hypothetical protein
MGLGGAKQSAAETKPLIFQVRGESQAVKTTSPSPAKSNA